MVPEGSNELSKNDELRESELSRSDCNWTKCSSIEGNAVLDVVQAKKLYEDNIDFIHLWVTAYCITIMLMK